MRVPAGGKLRWMRLIAGRDITKLAPAGVGSPALSQRGNDPAGDPLDSPAMSILRLSAVLGFLGVALGAFGAHGLKSRVGPEMVEVWKTGVLYHLFHVLALLAVALAGERIGWRRPVAALFTVGIVIFSGSLYVLTLSGKGWLGAVTPLGGVAFLAGWAAMAASGR
jgi:uncharacterized membrane protein YgdD (TMEM256/DUF423 family)